jgi:hypothetical protein
MKLCMHCYITWHKCLHCGIGVVRNNSGPFGKAKGHMQWSSHLQLLDLNAIVLFNETDNL